MVNGTKWKYLHKKFQCNNSEFFTVIEYINSYNLTILFDDGTKMFNQQSSAINKGTIKNPNHIYVSNSLNATFYGFGYMGIGKYTSYHFSFDIWCNMFSRCYNKNTQLIQSTYIDCSVASIWHNFQNFAEWCENNYIEGFQLDKDILIKGNKIYSPETCCFVPQEINNLFLKTNIKRGKYPIGVHFEKDRNKYTSKININNKYKRLGSFNTITEAFQCYKFHKEKYIKWMALTWFIQKRQISEKVYKAMLNYQVEIND